jgi:hypothetical protein
MLTAAGVCNILGAALKGAPSIPNWTIPLILPVIGALTLCAISGWNGRNFIAGIMAGGGAVGAHQAVTKISEEVHRRKTGNTEVLKKPPNE